MSDDEDIKAVEDILMKNAKELEKQFFLAIPNNSAYRDILSKDIGENIETITSAFGPLLESDQLPENMILKGTI